MKKSRYIHMDTGSTTSYFGNLPCKGPNWDPMVSGIDQSAVVRLLSYGRTLRPHTSRKKIPYLMLLAPDRLVLYTAVEGKHDDMVALRSEVSGYAAEGGDGAKEKQTGSRKVISLTASSEFTKSGTMSFSGSGKLDSDEEEDEEELMDGQEFRLGVSINQIIDVHVINDRDMCVIYHPNKPSKRWVSEEEMSSYPSSLVRSLVTRMSFSASSDRTEPRDVLSKFPQAHFFIIRFQNSTRDDVFEFRQSLHQAAKRFHECMAWMSKQLPLKEESRVVMVTSGLRGAREGNFCHPLPTLGESIWFPQDIGKAMADAGSDLYLNSVIMLYLETPVGTSEVEISLMDLERSFTEGCAPIDVVGTIHDPPEAPVNFFWQVSIQCRAGRSDKAKKVSIRSTTPKPGRHQTYVARKQSLGIGIPILCSLVALKTGAAVARQCKSKHPREKHPRVHIFDWSICILSIDITLEPDEGVRGAVPRMMSTSAVSDVAILNSAKLPAAFQHLMNKYPEIIQYDTAKRFLVGLDSESKAYHGLIKMVEFWSSHRLERALSCPQPAFESMKRHYPHGLIGWSSKSDCLIEFEAMGKWPDAYKSIIAEGFSEEDILQHLLFCYLFTFQRIDNRPWPKGKTVKIMDIDGLQMSHLGHPGFKFITNIANVLAIMFPQRMHQCIFVNVPSWWSMAWRIMSPMIPEKVRSQMQMFGKNNSEKAKLALLEWIDDESLPTKYGGKNDSFFSEYEQTLVEYARSLNE